MSVPAVRSWAHPASDLTSSGTGPDPASSGCPTAPSSMAARHLQGRDLGVGVGVVGGSGGRPQTGPRSAPAARRREESRPQREPLQRDGVSHCTCSERSELVPPRCALPPRRGRAAPPTRSDRRSVARSATAQHRDTDDTTTTSHPDTSDSPLCTRPARAPTTDHFGDAKPRTSTQGVWTTARSGRLTRGRLGDRSRFPIRRLLRAPAIGGASDDDPGQTL